MTKRKTASALSPDQAIGMTVNQVMFTQGVTRAELGRRVGISSSSVSMKLRGQVGWSLEDIFDVAEALDLEISAILPSRNADGSWVPAPYVPGSAAAAMEKAPVPSGAETAGVPPVGLEPTTFGLKVRSSDQLS